MRFSNSSLQSQKHFLTENMHVRSQPIRTLLPPVSTLPLHPQPLQQTERQCLSVEGSNYAAGSGLYWSLQVKWVEPDDLMPSPNKSTTPAPLNSTGNRLITTALLLLYRPAATVEKLGAHPHTVNLHIKNCWDH